MDNLAQLVNQLQSQPIIFIGGKGGVGKTTTAAALAAKFAEKQQKTLIVSTDPAHSLGDVFATSLKNAASSNNKPIALSAYLDALELDPDSIIDEHFARVERTISSYANPDMMPKIKEHLQLSKSAPGAQEAAMLEAICRYLVDSIETGGYQHIIFDTAPTGHTLRLLILPEMMEAWTDGLLTQQRRQAKLKGAADNLYPKKQKSDLSNPFAEAKPVDKWQQAVDVLNTRKNLFRRAGELLHDRQQTAVVLVMTADNLPIEETRRAVEQLNKADLPPAALVVNQLINAEQKDEFWQKRAQRQQSLVNEIKHHFANYPLYAVYLQQSDVRGREALARLK